jgi:predicted nucleotidyltransferase
VNTTLRAIIDFYSAHHGVTAIALGGSHASRQADERSDYDVYLFTTAPIDHETRRDLALRFDVAPEIGNSWWGDDDAWSDGDAGYEVMYWDSADFEHGLRQVIDEHRPSLGYSTSFWFTMRNALPLHDRDGWLSRMKLLAETPYPEELRRAIVAFNAPLLRGIHVSYRHQIALAVRRNDPVSVNHRIAALLASVFDIVFALTRTLHPGEKRQLPWIATLGEQVPAVLDEHIRGLLAAACDTTGHEIMPAVDALCHDIERMIDEAELSTP